MKKFIVSGMVVLSIVAAACGSTSTTGSEPSNGISQENQVAADLAWDTLGPTDQDNFCLAMDTFSADTAGDIFNKGAGHIFSHEEAVQIVTYIDEQYC